MWEGDVWYANSKIPNGGKWVYNKRPYLQHRVQLHVITVQNKAWMDSVAMVMRCQLILAPFLSRSDYDVMLEVVDNVGSHHNRSVVAAYKTAGWLLRFGCKNMTHLLQPMDVSVNGPVKAAMRKMRIELSFDYFSEFRANYYQAKAEGKDLPKFDPPVPTMPDGIAALAQLRDDLFADGKFRDNLRDTFIKVGLRKTFPGHLRPYFVKYTDKSRGSLCKGRGKHVGKKGKGDSSSKIPESPKDFGSDFSLGGMMLNVLKRSDEPEPEPDEPEYHDFVTTVHNESYIN